MATLEVLICAYGREGIERVASHRHPAMEGVVYLVSWQLGDSSCEIPEALRRDDFKIEITPTRGLSRNRNHAFSKATAPLLLISDDDLDYSSEHLERVVRFFSENPDCDVAAFQYESDVGPKPYPNHPFNLRHPAKGWFLTSMELALRRDVVDSGVRFNPWFGVGSAFIAGEESLFLHDVLAAGFEGRYSPEAVCRNENPTTGSRLGLTSEFIKTKGAVFLRLHRWSWMIRMMVHAWHMRKSYPGGFFPYVGAWLGGVGRAMSKRVFFKHLEQ